MLIIYHTRKKIIVIEGKAKILKLDEFHNRFIVIDNKELYHIGLSLKD